MVDSAGSLQSINHHIPLTNFVIFLSTKFAVNTLQNQFPTNYHGVETVSHRP